MPTSIIRDNHPVKRGRRIHPDRRPLSSELSRYKLKLHVRNSLAHFKTPQWVSFVDQLPKTATGKVQKFLLRGGRAGIARQ